MPERIRLQRTKGWRIPPGTIKCDRSGRWGNPYRIGGRDHHNDIIEDGADAKAAYQAHVDDMLDAERMGIPMTYLDEMRAALRGKNLGCWCPEDAPCHVDVILKVVND